MIIKIIFLDQNHKGIIEKSVERSELHSEYSKKSFDKVCTFLSNIDFHKSKNFN